MIKKFYVFAWLLLVGSVLFSVLSGALNGLHLVAFSLMALALVYAFALWAVLGNTGSEQTE